MERWRSILGHLFHGFGVPHILRSKIDDSIRKAIREGKIYREGVPQERFPTFPVVNKMLRI